jgi:hypothetical protein
VGGDEIAQSNDENETATNGRVKRRWADLVARKEKDVNIIDDIVRCPLQKVNLLYHRVDGV